MDARQDASVELSVEECRELLITQRVGRVAFAHPDGIRIVPVNFVVRDGAIEFRTVSYSELAAFAPGSRIAFEVDELDPAQRRGWSVVVEGECVRDLERFGSTSTRPEPVGDTPWAGGRRPLALRLDADRITGRRVGGGEWGHPLAERA